MVGGAWWAAVHGVAKSWTWLTDFTFTFHFYALEKEMVAHSSVLAWRIPGMEEPEGLPSLGSHRVGHDWSDLAAAAAVPLAGFKARPLAVRARSPNHWTTSEFLSVFENNWLVNFLNLFLFLANFLMNCFCFLFSISVHAYTLGCVWLFANPWTVAHQAPSSIVFSQQEYWNGLPFPPPGNLLDPGIKLASPALQIDALLLSHPVLCPQYICNA